MIENVLNESVGVGLIKIPLVAVVIQLLIVRPVIVKVKGIFVLIVKVLPTKPEGFQV